MTTPTKPTTLEDIVNKAESTYNGDNLVGAGHRAFVTCASDAFALGVESGRASERYAMAKIVRGKLEGVEELAKRLRKDIDTARRELDEAEDALALADENAGTCRDILDEIERRGES